MNNTFMKICEDNISHIVKRPSMYGIGIMLESFFLGSIAFTGLLKHIPILKVIELWKDYRYRLFNSEQYLLSELPPDYIIQPNVDNTKINRVFDEVFAGLSMYYTKTKAEMLLVKSNNNALYQLEIEQINYLEAQMLLAICGEYNVQFPRIPLFYETFCKAILTQYAYCIIGSGLPSLYKYQYLFVPHRYLDIATYAFNDPRNLQNINAHYNDSVDDNVINNLYKANDPNSITNKEMDTFYWDTYGMNSNTKDKIQNQVLNGLLFVTKCVIPEIKL